MSADIFEAAHAPSSAIHSWDHLQLLWGHPAFAGLAALLGAFAPASLVCGVHWSALLSALAVAVVAVLVHRTIGHLPATPIGLIIAPFAMMARWALEMISWGAIIWAVLSWVNRESPMTYTLAVLLDPFMRPIRRVLPTFRGIDFSPLVLILITNLLLIVIVPFSRGFIIL